MGNLTFHLFNEDILWYCRFMYGLKIEIEVRKYVVDSI